MDPPGAGARPSGPRPEQLVRVAENLLVARDIEGSKQFASQALAANPNTPGAEEVHAVASVLLAAERSRLPNGKLDSYAVLGLDSAKPASRIPGKVDASFKRLTELLNHPRPNRPFSHAFAKAAGLVADAARVLFDPVLKSALDADLDAADAAAAAAAAARAYQSPAPNQPPSQSPFPAQSNPPFATLPQQPTLPLDVPGPRLTPLPVDPSPRPVLPPVAPSPYPTPPRVALAARQLASPAPFAARQTPSPASPAPFAARQTPSPASPAPFAAWQTPSSTPPAPRSTRPVVASPPRPQPPSAASPPWPKPTRVVSTPRSTPQSASPQTRPTSPAPAPQMPASATVASGTPPPSAFWTVCTSCRHIHQYDRVYEMRKLLCPSCRQSFVAEAMAEPPPIVPGTDMYFCTWGFFPIGFPGCPGFERLTNLQPQGPDQLNSPWLRGTAGVNGNVGDAGVKDNAASNAENGVPVSAAADIPVEVPVTTPRAKPMRVKVGAKKLGRPKGSKNKIKS